MIKIASIRLTGELLRQVLCMPGNIEIERVAHRASDNTFHLILRGDGLPDNCRISETGPAKELVATFFKDDESEVVSGVSWRAS